MHAIIETGGKQYKVAEGDTLFIEKLPVEAGEAVTFDKVLAVIDGENVTVGTPVVEGAKVDALRGEERQGQEDHRLQVQAQEGLPPQAGPPSALHQGHHRQDLCVR